MAGAPSIPAGLAPVAVPAEVGDAPVPRYVDCFIRDAEDRAEGYGDRAGGGRFVPGDHRCVFQILQWLLRARRVARGAPFLEWGSGQGLATIFAALLGFDALGVEIDAALVEESRELARRYGAPARFAQGSYEPGPPGRKVYTAKGRAVVYAYPWPGEEARFLELFAAAADAGAHLLLGLGAEDVRVFRKEGR